MLTSLNHRLPAATTAVGKLGPLSQVRAGVVIAVGPGENERRRFEDFFDSLLCHELNLAAIAVVDDAIPSRALAARLQIPSQCKIEVLSNPRNGRGSGWGAGLTAAIITGIRWLHRSVKPDFILKVDTDSLITGPFSERIHKQFQTNPEVGMLGSYKTFHAPCGDVPFPGRETAPAFEKLLRQFTVWRQTSSPFPRLQLGFCGKYGRIRGILRRALLEGYALGEHCQGGGTH